MSVEEKIKQVFGELENEFKRILDEIERGCFKRQIDVFDDFLFEVSNSETKGSKILEDHSIIEKQKLQELKKFWNTHPKYPHENIADEVVGYSQTMSYINEVAEFFEAYVKKFVELFGDTKKKETKL